MNEYISIRAIQKRAKVDNEVKRHVVKIMLIYQL